MFLSLKKHRPVIKLLTTTILFTILYFSMSAQDIPATFIGNCAFKLKINDSTYLFTDFPYHSGAYGYMEYDFEEFYQAQNGVALFTHKHRDHFDKQKLKNTNLIAIHPRIIGGVLKKAIEQVNKQYNIEIHSIKTNHKWSFSHYSYSVFIDSLQIYFTGDTENYDLLVKQKNIDVLFITPWLFNSLVEDNQTVEAGKIIIYHHRKNPEESKVQSITKPCNCELIIPVQGETYILK